MFYLNVDYSIVCFFLLITLAVGIFSGSGTTTIREYAIANKQYGTIALVLTYLATDIGAGSLLSDAASVYNRGIIVNISITSLVIAYIIRAIFIAPKMRYFNNCLTMAEIMGELYGSIARVITGLLSFLNAIILAGIQLVACGMISESLLGIPMRWGSFIGGIIITLYAAIGGIKAVTVTDVIQFFVLIVAVPLIACIAVHHIGGIKELFEKLPPEKIVVLAHERFYRYSIYFIIWLLQMGMIDPVVVQRMLMAKSTLQLRNQYLIISAFDPVFRCIVMLIGLAGCVLYPSIEGKNVVLFIIQTILPVGVKGLAIAGLLAIVMSSADSYLHVAGLTFTHDIVGFFYRKKSTNLNELRWVRYTTMLAGCLAIMIGIKIIAISYLGFKALEVVAPMLLFPFISGVMGLKPDKRAFIVSLLATLITFLISNLLLPAVYDVLSILISVLVNGLTFLGTHYILNQGFQIVSRSVAQPITDFQPSNYSAFFSTIKQCKFFPRNFIHYAQNQSKHMDPPYVLAGIVGCCNLILPYLISQPIMDNNTVLLLILRFIAVLLCCFLIVKDRWSQNFQNKYLPIFFYFTLLYCLPFLSMIMVCVTQGDAFWLVNMIFVCFFLMMLIDWYSMVWLTTLGIILGLLLFIGHYSSGSWRIHITSFSLIGYQVVINCLMGLVIAYRKQQQIDRLEVQKQYLTHEFSLSESDYLYNLQYQMFQQEVTFVDQQEPLQDVKTVLNSLPEKVLEGSNLVQQAIKQLDAFITYCKNSFYYRIAYLRLDIKPIEIDKLLSKITASLTMLGLEEQLQVQLNTQHASIYCDGDYITQLLVNSICCFSPEANHSPLILSIQDTLLHYSLQEHSDKDYTRELPAVGFLLTTAHTAFILQPFYQTKESKFSFPQNMADLIQVKNKRILSAHYGYSEITDSKQMLYVIPVDLRAIRSKIVDEPPLAVKDTLETEASLAIENGFFTQLQEKTSIDLDIIRKVIAHIKHIHQGQFRKSGELFYTHPLAVATLVLSMTQDQAAIIAALLHDTIEDTLMSLDHIVHRYGQEVAYIVDKLTHLGDTKTKTYLTAAAYHQKISNCHDPRVVMIKLADRLHNICTIKFHTQEKQKHIAQETLAFYVPLGRMLKLNDVNQVVDELIARCQTIIHTSTINRPLS